MIDNLLHKHMRYISLFIFTSILAACNPIETSTSYNKALTRGVSVSKPVYLSFNGNNSKTFPTFFFLFEKKKSDEDYILKVRWFSPHKEKQFNGTESTLALMLDTTEIYTLKPIKKPRIIAYSLDRGGFEEEATYMLTREQMMQLAESKNVQVELTGRYNIVTARLNKYHSLVAIREFLKNS